MRALLGYGVVSGSCFLLNSIIMIWADSVGFALMSSVMLAYVIVVVAGYILHSKLTFRAPLTTHSFVRYAIAMAGNVPLAFVITWLWRELAHLPMIWAAPLTTSSMILFNFLLSRWAIGSKDSAWLSCARS